MWACVWVGLVLCAFCVPIAHGSVRAATGFGEQPVASENALNEPTPERNGARALLERMPNHVFDTGAPGASTSSIVHGCGDVSPCIAMIESADVSLGHRIALAARAAEESADNAPSEAMTALDLVLMVLFAVGLIGYQLDRKQRLLRHSALFAAPPLGVARRDPRTIIERAGAS